MKNVQESGVRNCVVCTIFRVHEIFGQVSYAVFPGDFTQRVEISSFRILPSTSLFKASNWTKTWCCARHFDKHSNQSRLYFYNLFWLTLWFNLEGTVHRYSRPPPDFRNLHYKSPIHLVFSPTIAHPGLEVFLIIGTWHVQCLELCLNWNMSFNWNQRVQCVSEFLVPF